MVTSSTNGFESIELRVGRIVACELHHAARHPAYQLWIDFGPMGRRTSSAQLTALYEPDDLVGRLVIAAVNLGERRVAGFVSQVLVLGLPDAADRVVLLQPERDVPLGARVY
jgi:tRNA-binding protein